MAMDAFDRAIIEATQEGLPLVSRPYDEVARLTGIPAPEVIERMSRMQECGVIRRVAAVPNHYALGQKANGMTVWDVDDSCIARLGPEVGRLGFVTHCYRRPRVMPEWPYNLFAMVHGQDRDKVSEKAERIAALLGPASRAHDIIYSTRILKKTGFRLSA
ncbi:MAG: AsnC family transcriptional regulator [Hyphomicrobiales bacterium]|nr:AsnC family transcriptional regulator [Hyphomicrobiales bacterium]